LQFGVESQSAIVNSVNWKVYQFDIAYYGSDGQWHYVPAKSIEGSASLITYNDTQPYGVGGYDYTGVNAEKSNDNVNWKYTGSTIGNDVSLWTGSGIVYPRPTGV